MANILLRYLNVKPDLSGSITIRTTLRALDEAGANQRIKDEPSTGGRARAQNHLEKMSQFLSVIRRHPLRMDYI